MVDFMPLELVLVLQIIDFVLVLNKEEGANMRGGSWEIRVIVSMVCILNRNSGITCEAYDSPCHQTSQQELQQISNNIDQLQRLNMTDDELKNLRLIEIEKILNRNARSLRDYQSMPYPEIFEMKCVTKSTTSYANCFSNEVSKILGCR
ncbi:hypothetical protein Ahy_B06g081857 [Arachis hypogaea]|uniref:K-box domain-containing protein n=1 Tax=Arachis hypogaea TaxID=3818 RepID=A0A444YMA8_ARAHY|nr:hypothetical protein Ahy_B06g081857 [Arachis hypogaea]